MRIDKQHLEIGLRSAHETNSVAATFGYKKVDLREIIRSQMGLHVIAVFPGEEVMRCIDSATPDVHKPRVVVRFGNTADRHVRTVIRSIHFFPPEASPLRNSTTSPSRITYSLPSMRTLPCDRAVFIEPALTSSSYEMISALMKPR